MLGFIFSAVVQNVLSKHAHKLCGCSLQLKLVPIPVTSAVEYELNKIKVTFSTNLSATKLEFYISSLLDMEEDKFILKMAEDYCIAVFCSEYTRAGINFSDMAGNY